MNHTVLTFDEFVERFKPIKNPIDPKGSFDGLAFGKTGLELAIVQQADPNMVWSIVDGDEIDDDLASKIGATKDEEGEYRINGFEPIDLRSITQGFHFVNLEAYMVATVKPEDGEFVEVLCEDCIASAWKNLHRLT